MQLLSKEFEMSFEERRIFRRGANFKAICDVKYFLRSRLASVAPSDDLKFLSLMNSYRDENAIAANSCTKSALFVRIND